MGRSLHGGKGQGVLISLHPSGTRLVIGSFIQPPASVKLVFTLFPPHQEFFH